jgi:uncharacterized membrane protein
MAIEIHPPLVKKGDTAAIVWEHFKEILPEFLGLIVSFWLIASVWLRHHQLFKYIDNFDGWFMVINLWLLLTIVIFPFSTSFLFNSIFHGAVTKLQVFFYLGVPLLSNLIVLLMYKRVNRKHLKNMTDIAFHDAILSQLAVIIGFVLVITWVAVMPLQYHPLGYSFFAAIPLLNWLFKKNKK